MTEKAPDSVFRENMEQALETHFPKHQCKQRSSGLMLFAQSIIEHERIICRVRKHLGTMLGQPTAEEKSNAKDFYKILMKK